MIENKSVAGFTIPELGLGTWLIGGAVEPDHSLDDEWIEGIGMAIDLGYRHIDTAEMYGGGHCEELVGQAISSYDRDSLFLTSKAYKTSLAYDDLLRAIEVSLKKLGTSYLDLYLLHAPNHDIPLSETMRAMTRLVDEGMTKYIGVSNFTVAELEEAQSHTHHKIVNNQIEYSLITRNQGKYAGGIQNMESDIIPYCQKNGIIVTAERPIERGLLARPGYPILDKLAEKYGKTQAQISINWLLSKDNVITIPKSSNKERLIENLGSLGWEMRKEDYELLDQTSFES